MVRLLLVGVLLTCGAVCVQAEQRRVAVILFNFPSNPVQPFTPTQVRNALFYNSLNVNGFYAENSFGKMSLSGYFAPDGDIYGWYTIQSEGGCDATTWIGEAITQAQAEGFNAANYEHVITLGGTYPAGCPTGLNGAFGSNIRLYGSTFSWQIVSHELGHCLGIQHASYRSCVDAAGNPVSISNTCTYEEYGDVIDIMGDGGSRGHLNAYNKWRWFDPANILTINSVSQAGTYTITPIEASSTGLQVIRIVRAANEYYYLEFRQPLGYDSNVGQTPITQGVSIRVAPPQQGAHSYLLSMIPPQFSIYTVGLTPNNTFSDSQYGIHVATTATTMLGTTVNISFDGTCFAQTPYISVTPNLQAGSPGQTLTYTVTLTNNDSIGCAPRTLTVNSTLPSRLSQQPSTFTETLAPGAVVEHAINITASQSAQLKDYLFSESFGSGKNKVSTSAIYRVQ